MQKSTRLVNREWTTIHTSMHVEDRFFELFRNNPRSSTTKKGVVGERTWLGVEHVRRTLVDGHFSTTTEARRQ